MPPSSIPHRSPPFALCILTFAEFWDRFSYYGVQALLVLYLTKIFLFSDGAAYSLFGVFTALTFASTILGGIIADKLIGFRNGVIVGAFFMVLGNLLLILPSQNFMYVGLATLICGVGFFKPNSASLVGVIYEGEASHRERGFSIFYMGMNAGALLGPLMYGYVSKAMGWHAGFLVSTFGILLSLTLLFLKKVFNLPEQKSTQYFGINRIVAFFFAVIFFIGIFTTLMRYSNIFGSLLGVIGITTIFGLAFIALKSQPLERKHIIGLGILSFFCIFYFACSLQTSTTLTLFIERGVNRSIFGFQLPTMMFLSLQPFFIILSASFMGSLWSWLNKKNIFYSIATKLAIGLFLAAISFFIFAYGANCSERGYSRIISVIIGNFFLGIGELCTLPILFSAISEFSPKQWRSTMMGILFLSLAFSGYFAGLIAKVTSTQNIVKSASKLSVDYANVFIEIGIAAFIISLIILALAPLLKNLLQLPNPMTLRN